MTSLPSVAVTGSTGFVGNAVARSVADAGVAQRLLVRSVAKAPQLRNATVLPFTYADRAAATSALDGVQTLFMISASESADRIDEHRTFVDSAVAAGVQHVVYTSFVGAAPDATFTLARDHYATETYIKEKGLGFTFLRDNFYLDFMSAMVGDDGIIRGPAADGRAAIVARADVARVAAAVVLAPERHKDVTYNLTGPEALTMTEIAAVLAAARRSPVTFHNESIPEAYESRKRWPAPDWQYDAWVSTYTSIASGAMAAISTDVETVTGRPPMSLEQFLAATRSPGE
ncbi:NmrA family NAD(P)-binding protein [Antrihabitans sp. YC3-6]|uniref:NmrA family NAD(P)-binding protein n=1 Tax=Antrihabitans stalagmiti TaxID=2799499 RepID=A0A934U6C2_9NOCA|nr:NmrA family NAD(P)-binding protein [Antrihabitans stalagmiti]MBJ8342287.1 NmrA family NAD(P)-binding protein [Antrihabitans stalagmiti]